MPEGSELEIKLSADPHLFEQITTDPDVRAMLEGSAPVTRSFETLYYDTSDFVLQHAGFAYRVRREGEEWVATLKSDLGGGGGLFTREEWNEKQEGPKPSLQKFSGSYAGDRLLALVGESNLQLLFFTRFDRTVMNLRTSGGTMVELALDRGMIWSGSDGSPIGEIELELKEGSICELLDLAGWMSLRWHLKPEWKSKYARGVEILSRNQLVRSIASPARILQYPMPAALLDPCVTELFICQVAVLEEKATPASIRTIRIQIRRLRALIRFFQPILPNEDWQIHADHLQQWGALLGGIRDIDLMEKDWTEFSQRYYPASAYFDGWVHRIRERREFLAESVTYRLNQGELTQNIFVLQSWYYRGMESESVDEEGPKAEVFVRKLLMQTIKNLRDDIREICRKVDIKIQHRFRIRIKRLRYILEALSVIHRYRDDAFVASLQKLQTELGKIHDVYQIKSLLDQFETDRAEKDMGVMKELFISWRSRDLWENLSALPKETENLRKTAKDYLRTLASLRTVRRAKSRHDPGTHEPGQ